MSDWRKAAIILAMISSAIVLVQIAYWIGVAFFVDKPDSAGTFGDMFGALNTFFAGLAFSGVVITLYLQMRASTEARRDQAASLDLVQKELSLIREDVELQRARDRVEAGPFFRLATASTSGSLLDFAVENVGAPVIVKEFHITNAGCSVREWYPSTLPTNVTFQARCYVSNPSQREYAFRMLIRDRWGAIRSFELQVTIAQSNLLDFHEIAAPEYVSPA